MTLGQQAPASMLFYLGSGATFVIYFYRRERWKVCRGQINNIERKPNQETNLLGTSKVTYYIELYVQETLSMFLRVKQRSENFYYGVQQNLNLSISMVDSLNTL